jgi:hypothetical protein
MVVVMSVVVGGLSDDSELALAPRQHARYMLKLDGGVMDAELT